MWCRQVRNQLSAYADGELRPAENRSVEEHLAQCEACAQEYAGVKQVVCLTALIPEEAPPSSLQNAILTRIAWSELHPEPAARTERQPARAQMWAWGALAGAALTGATASLAVGLINSRHPGAAPTPGPAASAPTAVAANHDSSSPRATPRKVYIHASVREHVQVAAVAPAAHEGASGGPVPAAQDSAPRKPRAVSRVTPVMRAVPAAKPAGNPDVTTDPVTAPDPVKPEVETPEPAAPATPPATIMAAMPGPAKSDGDAAATSMMASMERDAASRGGSVAEDDSDLAPDSDEGLQMLKSFLEERSRTVPQPPSIKATMRRMRKTL